MSTNFNKKTVTAYGLFICVISTLFYIYDFVLRVLPGTIFPQLITKYHINPAELGLLSSFFFLGYIIMQLPCGLLYDRFGPRIVMSVALFIAACASLFFISTPFYTIASSARFLMGFGSAFAYIGSLVLVSRWLPSRYFAISAGLIQFMGCMGAVMGGSPIAILVAHFGANNIVHYIGYIGIGIAIFFALFIRNAPKGFHCSRKKAQHILAPLKHTLKNKQNWLTASYGFFIWAPISIFAALWAVPFFKEALNTSTETAAFVTSFLWIGIALGGPVFAFISIHIQSRRIPLQIAATIGIVSSAVLIYGPHFYMYTAIVWCLLVGLASSAQAVTFGLVKDNNKPVNMGTASGFNNMAIVLGGVIFQPLVGVILQLSKANQQLLTLYDFKIALIVLPLCYALGLIIVSFFIRETHCQVQTSEK